jgi:hypothetical protein
MNTYKLKFKAKCPNDGTLVEYDWALHTCYTYMTEELRRVADSFVEGYQERIADELHERFGGQQVITAVHAGDVRVETRRPEFVHWARPSDGAQPARTA